MTKQTGLEIILSVALSQAYETMVLFGSHTRTFGSQRGVGTTQCFSGLEGTGHHTQLLVSGVQTGLSGVQTGLWSTDRSMEYRQVSGVQTGLLSRGICLGFRGCLYTGVKEGVA